MNTLIQTHEKLEFKLPMNCVWMSDFFDTDLGPDWGPARTLKIWGNKIAWFRQIGPMGFILGAGPNTHSSHVAS